MMTCRFISY